MKIVQLATLVLGLVFANQALRAADNPPASIAAPAAPEQAQQPKKREIPGVNLTHGPAVVKLGKVAELTLPEGYSFVGPDSLDKFYALTQNTRSGNEVGVVLSPAHWLLFFDYDDIGYVKDDEKKDLDAAKLYQTIEEGQIAANESRKKKGWDELKLRGWATEPHYDEKTHNLKWAFKLSSSSDQHQSIGINENIKLLGRGGVMNVVLVGDLEAFKEQEAQADQLLTEFRYVPGSKYAEFRSGDKIAKIGLTALVVGGAGVAAAKLGLLGKLGGLLAKLGKGIVLIVAGIGAAIAKLWKKIVGRDKVE
ncbi:MAG: DUF2167 domain-containing protein [Nibricoccus sp.]